MCPARGQTTEDVKAQMLRYYNERAPEYDHVYVGKGPALPGHEQQYIDDIASVSRLVAGFGRGHLIDVACGTGFWAPHYAHNVERITFLDQSANVLTECRQRVSSLPGVHVFLRDNVFDVDLAPATYDAALVGFFLSHVTRDEDEPFFRKLRSTLKPASTVMVMDSLWNDLRAKYRAKEGIQERALGDGRRFKVYKRHFTESDLRDMLESRSFRIQNMFAGDIVIAAIANRIDGG